MLLDREAFEGGSGPEALVGGEEREMLGLLAAEDEGGGELESVCSAQWVDTEETDGAGADFVGRGDFGPLHGDFRQAFAGCGFLRSGQLSITLPANQ